MLKVQCRFNYFLLKTNNLLKSFNNFLSFLEKGRGEGKCSVGFVGSVGSVGSVYFVGSVCFVGSAGKSPSNPLDPFNPSDPHCFAVAGCSPAKQNPTQPRRVSQGPGIDIVSLATTL